MKNNWQQIPSEDNITRTTIPNGIVVLVKPNFNNPSVILSGYLRSGSVMDPENKPGLAFVTSMMLMRGTARQQHRQIYDRLETAGASLGIGSSVQSTSFGGKALAEDLPLLLNTLAQCVRYPTFPQFHLKMVRSQLTTGLLIKAQDTGERASSRFDEILFPGHPYGRPEEGTIDSIQSIQKKDLEAFHQRYYSPEGMVICIVGAIEPVKALDLVQAYLGDWSKPETSQLPSIPLFEGIPFAYREHIEIEEKSQTDLVIGTYGPRRSNEDFLTASLANHILGQFGMMGRIGQAVREESSLAYYASSALNAWHRGGSWEIYAGVNPANVDKTITTIKAVITEFISQPAGRDEIADAKSSLTGMIPLSLESNAGIAGAILNMERFHLGFNYLRDYPHLIRAISAQQILNVTRKYLDPEKLVIISAGTSK